MLSLSNVSVLDLTQRLPGPLATKQLQELGAKVLKLTPLDKEDAFLKTDNAIFNQWYKSLNRSKETRQVDFKKLQPFIDKADIIIAPYNFNAKDYQLSNKALVLVHGSSLNKPIHDLNALAVCEAFYLYTLNNNEKRIDPPFLPIAGIQYGSSIALEAVAALLKVRESNQNVVRSVYLDTSVKKVFDLFWNQEIKELGESKFLHNGLFPCYNIYKTKDEKFVALACVEEHYFAKFNQIFNLSLKNEDRFDTSSRVFNILINLFSKSTLSEITTQAGDADICLTPVG